MLTTLRARPTARAFLLSPRFDGCASIDGWDAPSRTWLASPPSCSPQAPVRGSAGASSLRHSRDARSSSTSSNVSTIADLHEVVVVVGADADAVEDRIERGNRSAGRESRTRPGAVELVEGRHRGAVRRCRGSARSRSATNRCSRRGPSVPCSTRRHSRDGRSSSRSTATAPAGIPVLLRRDAFALIDQTSGRSRARAADRRPPGARPRDPDPGPGRQPGCGYAGRPRRVAREGVGRAGPSPMPNRSTGSARCPTAPISTRRSRACSGPIRGGPTSRCFRPCASSSDRARRGSTSGPARAAMRCRSPSRSRRPAAA